MTSTEICITYFNEEGNEYFEINEKDIIDPMFIYEFMKYEEEFCNFPYVRVNSSEKHDFMNLIQFSRKYMNESFNNKLFDILNSYLRHKLKVIEPLKSK